MTEVVKKQMVKRSCLRAASFSADHERSRVLLRWAELVLRAPAASTLGCQLMSETENLAESNKCFVTIADALRSKATSTLKTRASSLALYFSWCDANLSGTDFLPFREPQVYAYLCDLRSRACPASRGTTFLSSLTFAQEVVGVEGAAECVVSARCRNATLKMYLGKRPLKQASELTTDTLGVLELACFMECDTYLRQTEGF